MWKEGFRFDMRFNFPAIHFTVLSFDSLFPLFSFVSWSFQSLKFPGSSRSIVCGRLVLLTSERIRK